MKAIKKIFDPNKLSTLLFYSSILAFIIAFNFAHNPPGGWTQQYFPNPGGRSISDICFLDSLTGWVVTPYSGQNDTAYVLKTTDGGDNWNIVYTRTGDVGFQRIYFLNSTTGFVCGANDFFGYPGLSKSTDGGFSWITLNVPDAFDQYNDMSVLNEDTIWLVSNTGPPGGVYRTTNGGAAWTQQTAFRADKIYMYNSRIGFIGYNGGSPATQRTTNGGLNWVTVENDGFRDVCFIDSLTGWKAYSGVKKTTDGGITWISQQLPTGGNIITSQVREFSNVNKDTIWGVGGDVLYPGIGRRGMIYRTTNGGDNWLYQVPDTSININTYFFSDFVNRKIGWSYHPYSGIHTIVGGDSIFYPLVNINQISSEVPSDFKLFQNYPNPFNPATTISFNIKNSKTVKIAVYNIEGKEISILVNKKLNPGEYQYLFDAGSLSSGVYFYSLFIDEKIIDTKKMILLR